MAAFVAERINVSLHIDRRRKLKVRILMTRRASVISADSTMSTLKSSTDCVSPVLRAADTVTAVWARAGIDKSPRVAVILGSGLGGTANSAVHHGAIAVPYEDVPGMPMSRVEGHAGRLVTGGRQLNRCVLLQGRSHFYEGWSLVDVTFSVSLLAELGVRTLILTNAAGGISSHLQPGDLMTITDHLSLIDMTPLNITAVRPGVFHTGQTVWSHRLRKIAHTIETELQVHSGCYAMMPGPNYETPAEVRMLSTLGADAVGMSTVPEAIMARQLGMEVLGVSCITNAAAGRAGVPLDHQDIGNVAVSIENGFIDWLQRLLGAIDG
ncbi:MAG: purine-nucleoside phosphorylase [Fuerstiella sp.]|nr:purine-nucleoside phosphorylase [Fuerstiella sp.]